MFTAGLWVVWALFAVIVACGAAVAVAFAADLVWELTRRPGRQPAAAAAGDWVPRTWAAPAESATVPVDPVSAEIDTWELGDWPLYEDMKRAGELAEGMQR
jgi:hypothetical protein